MTRQSMTRCHRDRSDRSGATSRRSANNPAARRTSAGSVNVATASSAGGVDSTGAGSTTADPAGASTTRGTSSDVSGSITVLTNRTDLVDTVFKGYAVAFNGVYPDVKVNFEAITDYESEVFGST